MEPSTFLATAAVDGDALLAAAQADWRRPVPHCPAWDAADLVRHTGGIFTWMAAIVSSGERVNRRSLDPPPEDLAQLPAWFVAAQELTLAVLGSADPDALTWTFSSTGDHKVRWWYRRLAVEVAIHRWDIQHAAAAAGGGPGPGPLDGEVAAAGIEEFFVEFLPGLLAADDIGGLGGTLHLHATDGPTEWWADLDGKEPAVRKHAKADVAVRGTRSDLLLWLTNREPAGIEVMGDGAIADRWSQLRR